MSRGRAFNTDLLLAASAFALMIARESLPGLFILVLTEAWNVAESMISAQAKSSYLELAEAQIRTAAGISTGC